MPFSMVNNGQSDTSIVYFERKFRQTFVNYIVKVYATIWFEIKSKPSFTDGSHHPFRIVDPVIQRNSYFAHPENLLIAMATDERPHIR